MATLNLVGRLKVLKPACKTAQSAIAQNATHAAHPEGSS